jgi:hypothetical protein
MFTLCVEVEGFRALHRFRFCPGEKKEKEKEVEGCLREGGG